MSFGFVDIPVAKFNDTTQIAESDSSTNTLTFSSLQETMPFGVFDADVGRSFYTYRTFIDRLTYPDAVFGVWQGCTTQART